ncbi:C3a anaphylatoxin chemotactic receptor-like [Scyliorhinus canicula]|uniref:C3a anaphylatoxin chemotactic receptor-like n=1 Tax=Scyliorhinus canicula TaxID=7830 RepID=UPI0018F2C86D|nr:C3a anaphylatoxin chemotactic receptor-like [Scyliorhinus canicula]
MELSNNGTDDSFRTQDTVASIVLGLACLLGVPGNSLVIWIIGFAMKKQRSPTVLLILNLAVADMLVLITLPLWIYAFLRGWAFGEPFCKIVTYVIHCNMYVSIFLITVMSVERFMAVIYPFATKQWRTNKVIMKVVLAAWILAFLFAVPVLIHQVTSDDDTGQLQCLFMEFDTIEQEILCEVLQMVIGFVIPFTVLSICYFCIGRKMKHLSFTTKNRAGLVIGSVVIVFFICWVPHHILKLISVIAMTSDQATADTLNNIYNAGIFISGALVFMNSCVNPILYAFAARNIRSSFRLLSLARLFDQMTHTLKEESGKECTDTTRKDTSVTMDEMASGEDI